MAHYIHYGSDIGLIFTESCTEGMSECVSSEFRKQKRFSVFLNGNLQLLIVVGIARIMYRLVYNVRVDTPSRSSMKHKLFHQSLIVIIILSRVLPI